MLWRARALILPSTDSLRIARISFLHLSHFAAHGDQPLSCCCSILDALHSYATARAAQGILILQQTHRAAG